MRPWFLVSLGCVGVSAATYACVSDDVARVNQAREDAGLVDSGGPEAFVPTRCNPVRPFAPAEPMAEIPWVTGGVVASATLTQDEKVLYYIGNVDPVSSKATGKPFDMYTATRSNPSTPFESFQRVEKLSAASDDELSVSVTGDGKRLYFARSAGSGSRMAYAEVSSTGIGDEVFLNFHAADAAVFRDTSPYVRADGTLLYFASIGPGTKAYDIVKVKLPFDSASGVVPIPELNSGDAEGSPVASADEKHIYFTSNRGGSDDVWTASRSNPADPFAKPEREASLSSPEEDYPTWLSADECVMYLTRTVTLDGSPKAYRIYVAKRPP
jgi:hypothetical protein